MEHHTRLELATDAWKAPMLPLHQWCIRYALAYLKEGGIYIMHLYYIKIFVCCQIFQKNCLAVLYPHHLLRSRGTCIAHYACRMF